MLLQTLRVRLPILVLMPLIIGCSRSEDVVLVPVTGTVQFKNKPVPSGHVSFRPLHPEKVQARRRTLPIKNGRFQTPADAGIPGGIELHIEVIGTYRKGKSVDVEADPEPSPLFPTWKTTALIPVGGGALDLTVQ